MGLMCTHHTPHMARVTGSVKKWEPHTAASHARIPLPLQLAVREAAAALENPALVGEARMPEDVPPAAGGPAGDGGAGGAGSGIYMGQ